MSELQAFDCNMADISVHYRLIHHINHLVPSPYVVFFIEANADVYLHHGSLGSVVVNKETRM